MENSSQLHSAELEILKAIYGSQWCIDGDPNSYTMTISSDVKLFITLHPEYPETSPPRYDLHAPVFSWKQKKQASEEFQTVFEKNCGMPILHQWIERLKHIAKQTRVRGDESLKCSTSNQHSAKDSTIDFDLSVVHGRAIYDRKSVFQGHLCRVKTEEDTRRFMEYLLQNKKIAEATHNIQAYRIRKSHKELLQAYDDDGEKNAGGRLLHLVQRTGAENVMVVVSRWRGPVQLGAQRFKHINDAALQVLTEGKFGEVPFNWELNDSNT